MILIRLVNTAKILFPNKEYYEVLEIGNNQLEIKNLQMIWAEK